MPQIKKNGIIAVLISGALLALAGCSSPNKDTGFNTETGKHVENWYVDHRAAFFKNTTSCNECHGTDFKGGISTISCYSVSFLGMTCHANGPSNHPAIWENPFYHGAAAKSAPSASTGFSYCQICHGNDFAGGLALQTCLNTAGCHGANVNAPHSPKPWRGVTRTHTDTDPGNAPVCATCHTNGANSFVQPSPFNPGAAPGCFNNTLCHAAVGHPADWANPDLHGAAAKSAPTATTGFSICRTCHGNDFAGGAVLKTCLNTAGCHGVGVNAPHSPKPWRGGTRIHTNTDTNNAAVCATCHTNGANSSVQPSPPAPAGTTPGCFNSTLCHAAVGHPAGWALPTAHGPAAKAAPSSSAGFSLCQTCHGNDFTGGNSLTSCLNTSGCHGAGVNAPHSASWLPGSTYTHTTTDQGNAPVCALCHTNGLNSPIAPPSPPAPAGTPPDCFNNTLCHATPTCGTCHGIPPNGTVAPNVAGQHAAHIAVSTIIVCATCHTGAGFGTALHINGVIDVILDPTYNAKSGAASYNATTNTCSNVSCHGGQTTPGWLSGTVINVNTQCTLCHVPGTALGTPQYNSQYSGRHSTHAGEGIACYTCHDTALIAVNHFTTLNTTAMEGPASATLRSQLQYNGTSCNPSAGGLTGCHSSNNW